jgi:hypothetical protein
MFIFAVVFGVMIFLTDWAGFRGKFGPFGPPRELKEIWWHLPFWVVALFLIFLFWPWRIDIWDDM